MNTVLKGIAFIAISLSIASCTDQGSETGRSTPIDSTNARGTAPVTYGGDDPASIQDTTMANSSDTGTKANNVSNNGEPDNQVKNQVRRNER